MHKILKSRRRDLKLYMMENECPSELKESTNKYEVDFQLYPPNMHRWIAAEEAIQTYKDHFISELSTTDPNFPISEWDRIMFQCLITLNLIRNTRVNPSLSAYSYWYGWYDFNKTPIAPHGTHVVIHDKTDNNMSWGHHIKPVRYIGPSPDHYRYMHCYMPATGIVCIYDTL